MRLKDHLKSRHVDFNLHNPILDEQEFVATFYLWNVSGQIVGFQQYRPLCNKKKNNSPRDGRYFTYRRDDTVAVWGVESLHLTPHLLFLTEGIFDAARLTESGCSAIAVLSNDPRRDLRNWLKILNRVIVVVCDNDKAGKKLADFGDVVVYTKEKDLGESSNEFIVSLVEKFRGA